MIAQVSKLAEDERERWQGRFGVELGLMSKQHEYLRERVGFYEAKSTKKLREKRSLGVQLLDNDSSHRRKLNIFPILLALLGLFNQHHEPPYTAKSPGLGDSLRLLIVFTALTTSTAARVLIFPCLFHDFVAWTFQSARIGLWHAHHVVENIVAKRI